MSSAIPEYRVADARFVQDVRRGVQGALEDFAAVIGHPRPAPGANRHLYAALGQREWRSGRTLDALHAAYRLGARVVWRRMASLATAAGADARTVSALADSVFAYLDEAAAVSADGFAEASAVAAGQTARHRQRLLATLLDEAPHDTRALEPLARSAAWALPRDVAVLAIGEPDEGVAARRMPPDVLLGVADGIGCVVVPDPEGPGRPGQIEYAMAGTSGAVLGPTVPLELASRSWARASAVWRLAAAGRLDGHGLQRADDHLAALLLAGEPQLVDDLARLRLGPLDTQPPRSRERLEATLLAYLRHRGNGPRMAADLHVHPQTVRYRMGRLRELLGEALDDPDTRFELEVVLRERVSRTGPSRPR
ncbi:MAG TPA: helix-turn-helix domain-containing protein [Baekduia sp.]|nr:helix-turn-helix domain-containing protein [Baekduia sp.]